MHVSLTDAEQAFQAEVREFFAEKFPADLRAKTDADIAFDRDDYVRWQKLLHEQGWAAVNWPVEYGGTGWNSVQQYIFAMEMANANVPDIVPFGIKMVGPVVYSYGNDEQKARFLPPTLASDIWWCQGYSEPGAGSDLASLKTRAEIDGDHYVVNGTKTWTTLAQHADWIFCLVRTSSDVARRQDGISFLLIDMSTPGVSVRPIITIEGDHEVNEVHFEDVRVPVENRIGDEGGGWTYAKMLLQHERTNIAGVARSQYRLSRLRRRAESALHGAEPLINDANFRRRLAAVEIELKALEYTELRTLASVAVGAAPGPESSILKIRGTEIQQAIDALFMDAAGYYALPYLPDQYAPDVSLGDRIGHEDETHTSLKYFNGRKTTIYGGSNEIQKNIIAKHVLGL